MPTLLARTCYSKYRPNNPLLNITLYAFAMRYFKGKGSPRNVCISIGLGKGSSGGKVHHNHHHHHHLYPGCVLIENNHSIVLYIDLALNT